MHRLRFRLRWFALLGLALAAVPAAADDPVIDARSLYDVPGYTAERADLADAQRTQQIVQIVQANGWTQNLQCPQATLGDCLDPAWALTPCGMLDKYRLVVEQGSTCGMLVGGLFDQYGQLPWTTFARSSDGGVITARQLPTSTQGYAWEGTHSTYLAEINEMAAGVRIDPVFPISKHALWDTSMAVRSCEEYVWEKWYDWSKFEDDAAVLAGDDRAIFDRAYDPTNGIAYKAIYSRAPVPVKQKEVLWPTGMLPKNTYFLFQKTAFDKFPFDPSVLPDPAGRLHHTASWSWHKSMSDIFKGSWPVTDAELDYEYKRQITFQKLLLKRGKLLEALAAEATGAPAPAPGVIIPTLLGTSGLIESSAFTPIATEGAIGGLSPSSIDAVVMSSSGGPSVAPVTDPSGAVVSIIDTGGYTGKLGQLYMLDKTINDYLVHARDNGCFVLGWNAKCDWSPAMFADSLRGQFTTEREVDYQKCVERTANDFSSTSAIADAKGSGIDIAMPGFDYRRDSDAVRMYLGLWDSYEMALDWSPGPGTPTSPATGWWRADKQHFGLAGKWDVSYDYLVGYGLLKNSGAKTGLCDTDLRSEVMVKASAHLAGKPFAIIDGDNVLETQDGIVSVVGHLTVLDKSIYTLSETAASVDKEPLKWSITRSVDASATVMIGPFPVTIAIGASGEAGLKTHVAGAVTRVCPTSGPATFDIHGTLEGGPYASVDAFGSVAVGVSGVAEAKLQVELALLRMDLPFVISAAMRPKTPSDLSTLQLTADAELRLRVSALDGRVVGYATVPGKTFEEELFRWKGLTLDEPLWGKHWKIPVSAVLSKI